MAGPRILGVDPGTQLVGWGVAERSTAGSLQRIASGCLRLGRSPKPIGQRMEDLYSGLGMIIEEHQPARLILESAFFGKNARSALRLGESRGVVLLVAAQHGLEVLEVPPATIKARVAGTGAATKEQVKKLVAMHFELAEDSFDSEDEADALAIAASQLLGPSMEKGNSSLCQETQANPGRNRGKLPPGASFQ